ncbi:MAG: histidine kinase dimerization/phospho-acceptor domain-containing protein, partial [Chloroflexota bacterium]
LSLRAVTESTELVLQERLVIAQMAAREIDRLVEQGFYELEKATQFAAFDPESPLLLEEYHMLAHAYGRVGTLSLGVYFLDAQGRVVLSEPAGKLPRGTDLSAETYIRQVQETKGRSVSGPFIDPTSGKTAVALTIPILRRDGALVSMISGLVDVSSTRVLDILKKTRDLGHTGHAELVDSSGLIIASTDYGGFLKPGEHLPFYLRMYQAGGDGVENVPYAPWHTTPGNTRTEHHVMAFAPLVRAPWAVAVGGADWETFAPVNRLRDTLFFMGTASLTFLWVLTLAGARLLVRPVRTLTLAAQQMAGGNLEQAIRITEGGEIGVLAESVETMRKQLRESMEKIRRWSADLELKVWERTEELATRNRQLAAVSAVATAANQVNDLEGMLGRCLEVTLDETRMEAGAVRLLDAQAGRLVVAASRGDFRDFPCRDEAMGIGDCPCGYVASGGHPLYLGPEQRLHFRPPCRAPQARAVAVLPLKSPKGVLGTLYLSRSRGEIPGAEEQEILNAICNQIAIAIENARLVSELSRVRTQQEVDRMKAEFISAISHELRTPLGFIKGYATTLLREDIAVDATTRREFLQIIDEESNKLQGMIDELLDASRLRAGKFPMSKVAVPLKELLETAVRKTS